MVRVLSMFGLGAIFLVISPHLRQQVFDTMGGGVSFMDRNAPYSYAAGGVLVLCTLVFSLNRGSQAR